jgi:NADPH-dependent ferric siderophore reductase
MGPGGGVRFDPDRPALLVGDATTVGLFAGLAAAARAEVAGAVAVGAGDVPAVRTLLPGLEVLAADGDGGEAVTRWTADRADRHRGSTAVEGRAYLAGDARTLAPMRARLVSAGHARRDVVTKPYWSAGRTGL